MDTMKQEKAAEQGVASLLALHDFLVAKPYFEASGTDLLAFLEMRDGAKFARVQVKHRTLKAGSPARIAIPSAYVTDAFVVTLCLAGKTPDYPPPILVYFAEEVRAWPRTKRGDYHHSVPASRLDSEITSHSFDASAVERMRTIISRADLTVELRILLQYQPSPQGSNMVGLIYADDLRYVRVERRGITNVTVITSLSTGTESIVPGPPGDPSRHTFNPVTGTWSAKL